MTSLSLTGSYRPDGRSFTKLLMPRKSWEHEITKAKRALLHREQALSAELAQVREMRRRLKRILAMKPLSPRTRHKPS